MGDIIGEEYNYLAKNITLEMVPCHITWEMVPCPKGNNVVK